MEAKTILITRPKGDEKELRDELLALGHRVICEPLAEIFLNHTARAEVENAVMDDPDAIIITSKHALQALSILTDMRDMFLLCVGEATARIAENMGFMHVCMAGQNSSEMLSYIIDCYDDNAKFLHVSGEATVINWKEALSQYGLTVTRVIVYHVSVSSNLSDTIVEQLKRGQIDAVTFFSPQTARIFLELAGKENLLEPLENIDVFCLSEAIMQAASGTKWKSLSYADEPTLESLVSCVDNTYG